ncbi:MAG TPA: 50S ribosomal protein L29 [Desulfuromonadales bacterium]|jgi:large subunit ribosomal protein L29|nr:50S ribosomal protein L29 [Desulfuromonadales bacterium]
MKAKELRNIPATDLQSKQSESVKELFNLKFQLHTGRLENTSKLKTVRKDIARIKTILAESSSEGVSK